MKPKLTRIQKHTIVDRITSGEEGKTLAKEYGVSPATISGVWKQHEAGELPPLDGLEKLTPSQLYDAFVSCNRQLAGREMGLNAGMERAALLQAEIASTDVSKHWLESELKENYDKRIESLTRIQDALKEKGEILELLLVHAKALKRDFEG